MKSDYIYDKSTEKLAKEYNLTPDELAIVDLVSCGWTRKEAFKLVYRVGESWSPQALRDALNELFNKEGAKMRRKENSKEVPVPVTEERTTDANILESVSKENTLRDLIKAREKMVSGSKDWIEITKMIADITRMKQDEVKTEDNTITFYLPVTCHRCPMYMENVKAGK